MNTTINPKILEALAKQWPEHFRVGLGAKDVMVFEVKNTWFGTLTWLASEMPPELLDLVRGRLERIIEGKGWFVEYERGVNLYYVNIGIGDGKIRQGSSPNNYTEALAIAALRAEGVEVENA